MTETSSGNPTTEGVLSEEEIESLVAEMYTDDEASKSEEKKFSTASLRPHLRRVCVVGGGTAGYLTAIALRQAFPEPKLDVVLVEAPDVPIIGVGEATVDNLPSFLHNGLGLDIVDFYNKVRPTWKLGIRFEWGHPEPHYFNAPFGWGQRGIGLLRSLESGFSLNRMNLEARLMDRERVPIFFTADEEAVVSLKHCRHAYHLDNAAFVHYLRDFASEVGVKQVERHVVDAILVEKAGADPHVDRLITREGDEISADFFVDCTGFRSLLLGHKLGARFESFESSLFTDRALAFTCEHGGSIKPYTTAKTMDAGWAWTIPTEKADHCGYVFASNFTSEDRARSELERVFPEATEPRLIEFRSGRRDRCWIGNVFAVGNAYGFVEPLESTGILMIQTHIESLISGLRTTMADASRRGVNASLQRKWDSLRWFLAIHFKFNRKRDTEYWRAAREATDVSGLESAIELYRHGAPLVLRNPRDLLSVGEPFFYGAPGLDCLLLGQKVPTRMLAHLQTQQAWSHRDAAADKLLDAAADHGAALVALRGAPEILEDYANNDLPRYVL